MTNEPQSPALPYSSIDPAILEEMQRRFVETPLHALLGLEILPPDPANPDLAVVTMPVTPAAFGSTGNVHGGAIATLVDVSCASAASRSSSFRPGENTLVTADMHIRYLGRPKGEMMRGEARVLRSGSTLIVVQGTVLDDGDRVVATADFAAMVVELRQPLRPELQTDGAAAEM